MKLLPSYVIEDLPPSVDLETKAVLKALAPAKAALALLKGTALTIPNQGILIDTLALQEARASSEIENIVTTQDELFQGQLFPERASGPSKEVERYARTLHLGHRRLHEQEGLIANRTLIEMFQTLKRREDGFRTQAGTALKNDDTGEIVYIPPQDAGAIQKHMQALESFINKDWESDLDPLIKMALIHHQFESIHPFPDGNGRLGRILNVLYLTRTGELDIPILYLSRHINRTKADYYRLLQAVRDEGRWEDWVLYMLTAIESTAKTTLTIVEEMRGLMAEYKRTIRASLPKIYSQDLLNNLFRHPYTRIKYVQQELKVSRPTATKYLEQLADTGLLERRERGRDHYFVNTRLVALFSRAAQLEA